ncbi:MAG: Sec-independent protein translocase protein TatB [Pyrinomonadaceae bacterium]
MYLFIFESIGTSELMLIGIIALIFLGPRRLPEIAKKVAKIMAEFRGTASEFKETWQREVNFEEEAKALDINALEAEQPVARTESIDVSTKDAAPNAPEIKEMDPAKFEELKAKAANTETAEKRETVETTNDKKTWL